MSSCPAPAQQLLGGLQQPGAGGGEDLAQLVVHVALGGAAQPLGLLPVVIGQQDAQGLHRAVQPRAVARRRGAAHGPHQAVHVAQLAQRGPALVAPPPAGARRQPDREGLGEVVIGVLLGVGAPVLVGVDVAHEAAAPVAGLELVPVGLGEHPEVLDPFLALPQPVGVVDGVPRLVAQELHDRGAVLDLAGLLLLQARQAGVGQVEGHPDDRHPVRAAPGVGQVEIGLEVHLPGFQLPAHPPGIGLQRRAFDPQGEVAQPHVEEFVAHRVPTLDHGLNTCIGLHRSRRSILLPKPCARQARWGVTCGHPAWSLIAKNRI